MQFKKYEKMAADTDTYTDKTSMERLLYAALGIAGESGEVAEKLKKILRDEYDLISSLRRDELKDELGDILWYVAKAARELGVSLEDVALANLQKIQSRRRRGKISGSGDHR